MKKNIFSALLAISALLFLTACERPPIDAKQNGFRGTAMVDVQNPRIVAEKVKLNTIPPSSGAISGEGEKASKAYKNVQVLGDLSTAQFSTFMVTMTSWVAPKEGCAYCHNLNNLADDSMYTKVVSRRMIEMTQNINANWKSHVQETGVTCYTCHRGNNIPQNVWFKSPPQKGGNMLGNLNGQNSASPSAAYSSLPNETYSKFLLASNPARIQGKDGLPNGNKHSILATEEVYGIMMHFSQSLGVNCTYCHNTQAFSDWTHSTPQRAQSWHAIQMVKDVNNTFMVPLTSTFPKHRLGETGDVAKANCATCHQGVNKPLYGKSMLSDHPYLTKPAAEVNAKTVAMK